MIVVDANLVAYLVMPGERTEEAEAVLAKDPTWVALTPWRAHVHYAGSPHRRTGGRPAWAGGREPRRPGGRLPRPTRCRFVEVRAGLGGPRRRSAGR
jgi:hypothetical protein